MNPENAFVRKILDENDMTLRTDDPPAVTRFVFYLELDKRHIFTFHREYFDCRVTIKYFEEFQKQGRAIAFQKAYIAAVEEANNETTRDIFITRETFLDIFNDRREEFYSYSEDEERYSDRLILQRELTKGVENLELWAREDQGPDKDVYALLKEMDANNSNPEDRAFFYKLLTNPQFEKEVTGEIYWNWGAGHWDKPGYIEHDKKVSANLIESLNQPYKWATLAPRWQSSTTALRRSLCAQSARCGRPSWQRFLRSMGR